MKRLIHISVPVVNWHKYPHKIPSVKLILHAITTSTTHSKPRGKTVHSPYCATRPGGKNASHLLKILKFMGQNTQPGYITPITRHISPTTHKYKLTQTQPGMAPLRVEMHKRSVRARSRPGHKNPDFFETRSGLAFLKIRPGRAFPKILGLV